MNRNGIFVDDNNLKNINRVLYALSVNKYDGVNVWIIFYAPYWLRNIVSFRIELQFVELLLLILYMFLMGELYKFI